MHCFFKNIYIIFLLSFFVEAENKNKIFRVEAATIIWDANPTSEKFSMKKNFQLVREAIKLNSDNFSDNEKELYKLIKSDNYSLGNTINIKGLEGTTIDAHKSWFQNLSNEESSKFVLVSDKRNQCAVKVFESRHPRISAKCSMGLDSLKDTKILVNTPQGLRLEDQKNYNILRQNSLVKPHYFLSEQQRIRLNEFYYFDHPKIGLIIGVFDD